MLRFSCFKVILKDRRPNESNFITGLLLLVGAKFKQIKLILPAYGAVHRMHKMLAVAAWTSLCCDPLDLHSNSNNTAEY